MKKSVKGSTRHTSNGSKKAERPIHNYCTSLAKSLALTLLLAFLLLLAASLIAYFYKDPLLLITPLALLCSAATAFFGGMITAKLCKGGALTGGLLIGSLFTLLTLPLSLFFTRYASSYSHWICILLHLAFMVLAVTGAFLGKFGKPKKRKRRK